MVDKYNKKKKIKNNKRGISEEKYNDTFHLNHIFMGHDGYLYGLVHHVNGRQFYKKIAQRFLKTQGNGGCIRISDGHRISLNLYAPHSTYFIDNNYWILDSGRSLIKIYDIQWNIIQSIPTHGWGRGSSEIKNKRTDLLAVGLSTIRKRYLPIFPCKESFINGVQIFDVQKRESRSLINIENIEQVNTVNFIHLKSLEKIL